MDIAKLPSQEELLLHFDQWEKYNQRLFQELNLAKQKLAKTKIAETARNRIKYLFDQHVHPKYPLKRFNPDHITINTEDSYDYHYDGVSISYLGRETWKLGDLDYFVDRYITVDGHTILSEYMQ